MSIKLTQFSHGAGCGCKIAPDVLERILFTAEDTFHDPRLLVGNTSRDDAAVVTIDTHTAIISTTDFFMPIVDDPFDFGRIAAANAISDIYAMGGSPLMAIAILGWPVNLLSPETARQVIEGGRSICREAGIALAGGHSIDSPEPIFGLAVTGHAPCNHIVRNDTARAGDMLYLTKPLGIGILTSAAKKAQITEEDLSLAVNCMTTLNRIGEAFAQLPDVSAMTDVTGFGLAGHLLEICRGSGVQATLHRSAIPTLPHLNDYLETDCVPGGTHRNTAAFADEITGMNAADHLILCDPQTSGGLLVCVAASGQQALESTAEAHGLTLQPIGRLQAARPGRTMIVLED